MRIQSKPAGSKIYLNKTHAEKKVSSLGYSDIAKEAYIWVDGEDGRQYKVSFGYEELRGLVNQLDKTLPQTVEA